MSLSEDSMEPLDLSRVLINSEHQPVDLTIQTLPRTDHVLEGYDPAAKDEMENNNTFP